MEKQLDNLSFILSRRTVFKSVISIKDDLNNMNMEDHEWLRRAKFLSWLSRRPYPI